jgi:hypothetical protein
MTYWASKQFVFLLEWVDVHLIGCRFFWFCEPVQFLSWWFSQQELNREDVEL